MNVLLDDENFVSKAFSYFWFLYWELCADVTHFLKVFTKVSFTKY